MVWMNHQTNQLFLLLQKCGGQIKNRLHGGARGIRVCHHILQ